MRATDRRRLGRSGGAAAMRLSEISVKRPVFATVISLMLVIIGLLAAQQVGEANFDDVAHIGTQSQRAGPLAILQSDFARK